MKPNNIQKEAIETSKRILNYWLGTNDLSSPSHDAIIEDEINALDNVIMYDKEAIIASLKTLYKTIKYLHI